MSSSARPLVAVVDDEQDIVTFLRLALEDHGFEVVTAPDAASAMEVLESARPDVICLDLLMPRQTGVALYGEILRHPRLESCPIVIMSGLAVRAELPGILARAGGLPSPASFVEKPIDVDQLVRTLRTLVGRQSGVAP